MIVSFDLDSTLCNTGHRKGLINPNGPTDWDAYSMACSGDTDGPALELALLLQRLGATIVVCSARSVCAKEATEKWLSDRGLHPLEIVLYDETIHGTDYKTGVISHIEWKAQAVKALDRHCWSVHGHRLSLHVDDWPSVKVETAKICDVPVVIVHAELEDVGYDRN